MSRKGDLPPLVVDRTAATTVGALIGDRAVRIDLTGTALAPVPAFGRKLAKAARRRRQDNSSLIGVWRVPKAEGLAAFHYLALFLLPAADGFLTAEQTEAVGELLLVLGDALTDKPGTDRLDRAAAVDRVEGRLVPDSPNGGLDDRWVRRLKARARAQEALAAIAVRGIPQKLLTILRP